MIPGRDEAGELTWLRVHPVTPAIKGWKALLVLIAVAGQQIGTSVRDVRGVVEGVGWWPIVAVIGAVLLIGFVYAAIAWRMTRYAVDGEAVYLQTGVLFRKQRTARLDRVQAIDVVQPLLARIAGLAELKFEVAGGADSAVTLSFLREEAAQTLRNELLARAAGIGFGTPEQPQAPVAPEREVLTVPASRLVASLVRSPSLIVVVLLLGGVVAGVVATGEPGLAVGVAPPLLGWVGFLWQRFSGEFNFRAAQSADGIRLRHGLLESRTQTVPPGRVQAVRLSQPFLWRRKDWWRVQVNVAGYGATEGGSTESVLLPVGDRDEALLALWLVLPDLGTADPRALLAAALYGSGEDGFLISPRRARWLDPWSWQRNGVTITDRGVVIRRGRFIRQVVVVPHERTQSLGVAQGPWQRRLGLASVTLHSTPGPISPTVPHLDEHLAGALVGAQAERARTARAAAGPERWMRELAAAGPARSVPPAPALDVPPPPAPPPPTLDVPPPPAAPPPAQDGAPVPTGPAR